MAEKRIDDTIHLDQEDLDFIHEDKIKVENGIIYSGRGKGSYIVFITGPDKGNVVTIDKEKTIIGRESTSDIIINKKYVSKKHAKIVTFDNKTEIVDFGSTNGTYVNDTLVKRAELKDRDEIRIGDVIIKYFRIDLNDSQAQAFVSDDNKSYTAFYNQVLDLLRPNFGQMAARFLNRQISAHVGKSPYTISASDKETLAKWVNISAGLLLDQETARILSDKIRLLK